MQRLSRIITRVRRCHAPARHHGGQYTLLAQLASRDGITAVEIGFDLDVEKSTLSLTSSGCSGNQVTVMDPPAGRRGRGLHLTPKGQAVLKDAYPIWQEAQKRATAVMGQESRGVLDGLLAQAERLVN